MTLSIIQMPRNILVEILKNINNISQLLPTLLAHRCFLDAFTSCPGIAETIIRRQIHPQLLPLAIANIEASHKTYTHRDIDEVKRLYLDVFEKPERFTDRIDASNLTNPMPTSDLIQMGRIYGAIGDIVARFIRDAVKLITRMGPGRIFRQSESESLRFYRAFYRLELFFNLCRGDDALDRLFLRSRSCFFLLLHPPWELGQMLCVYTYLDWCFTLMGAKRVQPREIGLSNDDPLARDNMRRRWIDIWISQGLEFWLLVKDADSHEDRLALLASVIKRKYVFFYEMYLNYFPASRLFSPWLNFVPNPVEVNVPITPYEDSDPGPPTIWITCHQGAPVAIKDKKRIVEWELESLFFALIPP
ncbi:hypothetical protein F4680DRAFT_449223 [Xylaria scruposa]|nr:hypothetical protein F4680DRAFT_449223 [Xylaria scruposa]